MATTPGSSQSPASSNSDHAEDFAPAVSAIMPKVCIKSTMYDIEIKPSLQSDNKWNELVAAAASPPTSNDVAMSGNKPQTSKSALLHPSAHYPEKADKAPFLSGLILHRAAMAVKMAPKSVSPETLLALALRGAWPMSDTAPYMQEAPMRGKAASKYSSCMPMLHAAFPSSMNEQRYLEQHASAIQANGRDAAAVRSPITPEFLGDKWCKMPQSKSKSRRRNKTAEESQQHMTYFNGVFSANSDGTGELVVQVLEHIGADSEICIRTNPICLDAGDYLMAACLHDALQRILIGRADCRRVNFAVVPGELQILPGVWMTSRPTESLFLAALRYMPADSSPRHSTVDLPERLFGTTTADGDVVVAWKNGKCPTRAQDRFISTSEGFEMGFFEDEELMVVLWREGKGGGGRPPTLPPPPASASAPGPSARSSTFSPTMAYDALNALRNHGSAAAAPSPAARVSSTTGQRTFGRGRGFKRGRSSGTQQQPARGGIVVQPGTKRASLNSRSSASGDVSTSYAESSEAAETVRATAARILASMAGAGLR